ncbi:DNA-binding NarL/FixJ family response regulator [Catenulispora sp. GP43]
MLVDDHTIVREGFRHVLQAQDGIDVVAAADRSEGTHLLARRHEPDVILLDTRMDAGHGQAFLHRLQAAVSAERTRIALLTDTADDAELFRALRAGISGFLLKDMSEPELVHAVRSIASGHAVIGPALTRRLIDRFEIFLPPEDAFSYTVGLLTERERDVLTAIGNGGSNQQIARDLHLTTATVKSHVSNVLSKLGLPSRVHAALLAYRIGLVRGQSAAELDHQRAVATVQTFSATSTPDSAVAATVARRPARRSPITSSRRASQISGARPKGTPNESTT